MGGGALQVSLTGVQWLVRRQDADASSRERLRGLEKGYYCDRVTQPGKPAVQFCANAKRYHFAPPI